MKLYICYTYYHVLISLIKCINEDKYDVDLILASDIPQYKELGEKINNANICRNVIYCDVDMFKAENRYKNKLQMTLFEKRTVIELFPRTCCVDFYQYSDIYTFNDTNSASKYLIIKKIPYHLIEDALDYYKYFDKYYKYTYSDIGKYGWKMILKRITRLGFISFGQNKSCIDIEVNCIEGIKIPNDKVFEVTRKELFSTLTEKQKQFIYTLFAREVKANISDGKRALLFTQPLMKDKFVETIDEQMKVYSTIVRELVSDLYNVTIKPHPRDDFDYSDIVNDYKCEYIDKNIPSEVLNFNSAFEYDLIIAITTTSINFIDGVKERKMLGREYIQYALMQ